MYNISINRKKDKYINLKDRNNKKKYISNEFNNKKIIVNIIRFCYYRVDMFKAPIGVGALKLSYAMLLTSKVSIAYLRILLNIIFRKELSYANYNCYSFGN